MTFWKEFFQQGERFGISLALLLLNVIVTYRITKDPNNPELVYAQRISSTPATRLDVINLQEQLDMRLQQRQARETGICPVRRELFSQCFGKNNILRH
jgi:hypothetical protein